MNTALDLTQLLAQTQSLNEAIDQELEPLINELEVTAAALTHIAERMEIDMEALDEGMAARVDHATRELLDDNV